MKPINRLILFVALCFGLWISVQADCGATLTSSVDVDISSPKIIKKLWVDSVYPFTVSQGENFSINFTGTDKGLANWVVSGAQVTMTITDEQHASNTPNKPVIASAAYRVAAPLTQIAVTIVGKQTLDAKLRNFSLSVTSSSVTNFSLPGYICLRFSAKTAVLALLVAFCLGSFNTVNTADDVPCKDGNVEIVIPSGKVWMICDSNTGLCVCGPDYSGPNCNFYKSTCQPTEQQLANRFNFDDAMIPEDMDLPEPGESWCDSNFGSQIWRVSNRESFTDPSQVAWSGTYEQYIDQRVHIIGGVGFSPGLKYVISQTYSAPIAYEVNIDEYNIPHIDPKKKILLTQAFDNVGLYNFVVADIGKGGWMTEKHFVFLYYDQVFSMDISKGYNDRGGMDVVHIGNLTQFLTNSYYPVKLDDIQRCSNARRRPDGSLRMLCDITYNVGTLKQSDYTKIDSHSPNATCITAYWDAAGATAKIGYIVFDILSATPEDPQTNIRMHAKFINGVDSDEWFCFQSTRQWSSALQDYRTWVIWNPQNNGYKMLTDRSGEWATCVVIDRPADNSHSIGQVPNIKIKWRPLSEGGGIAHSVVHDYEGHGGHGWGQAMMQSGADGDCKGWCVAWFNFSAIPDDDPGVYKPTSAIGPVFNNGTFIYHVGLYGSYFHATPTNQGESIMCSSCDANLFNCSLIPRGSEVLRITPDKQGGGTVERIASTRDGSYTQYAVITNECEDDDGPCWALFQSTWYGTRVSPYSNYPSDIFIVRFR